MHLPLNPFNFFSTHSHGATRPAQHHHERHSISDASGLAAMEGNHCGAVRGARATRRQRAYVVGAETARQIVPAMCNLGLNVLGHVVVLRGADWLNAKKVLPWAALSGEAGVGFSKEFFGELARLVGPSLQLPPSSTRWWPYSTEGFIARAGSAVADAGLYTSGVQIGTKAGEIIRKVYGIVTIPGTNDAQDPMRITVADASQALMKILKAFPNGELFARLAPNAALDLLHRMCEAIITACMPGAKFNAGPRRLPWKDFAVRFCIGFGIRVAVTGLGNTAWLRAIASQNQAAHSVAGPYSAVVGASLRLVQPFMRDMLFQAYRNLTESKAANRAADEEAVSDNSSRTWPAERSYVLDEIRPMESLSMSFSSLDERHSSSISSVSVFNDAGQEMQAVQDAARSEGSLQLEGALPAMPQSAASSMTNQTAHYLATVER